MLNEVILLKFLEEKKDKFYLVIQQNHNTFIQPYMLGFTVLIYSGRFFIPLRITRSMVNKPFGLFSFSRAIMLKKKKQQIFIKEKRKK